MSTLAGNAIGVSYPSANAGAVDQWSLDIFAALRTGRQAVTARGAVESPATSFLIFVRQPRG